MNQKYLVIPRIQFQGANAQPAWWCVAPPGPMAFCGLGHAIARALGEAMHYKGIGIVLHDWKLRAEELRHEFTHQMTVYPHQHRGATLINSDDHVGGSMSLSGQPTVRGDGDVSVVLAFNADARIDPEVVARFLDSARIAGGAIETHRYSAAKGGVFGAWSEVRQVVRSGFAFCDRGDLLEKQGDADARDPLDLFLEATRRLKQHRVTDSTEPTSPPSEAQSAEDAESEQDLVEGVDDERDSFSNAWLLPYCAGLRAITPIAHRMWTREGVPHAFAEPLVGLGQLVSVRQADIPLWSHSNLGEDCFIVSQQSAVGPMDSSQSEEAEV